MHFPFRSLLKELTMNVRRKVAIVSPQLDPTAGGVEMFSSMLAEVMTRAGLDVRIFVPDRPANRTLAKLGLSQLQQSFSIRGKLRAYSPELVVSNGTLGFFGRNPWKRIHVFHGTMAAHSLADRRGRSFKDWLIKGVIGGGLSEVLSGFGAFRVAVSKSCAKEMRKYYFMNSHRIIPNGVRLLPERKVARVGLIFVGRRESRKGYDLAIELAAGAKATLAVAGPGSDSRTRDLGVLNADELRDLYSESQAMIFPSNYEACSFAVLEALSNGCAVVTTSVGWIPELLSAVPEYRRLIGEPNDAMSFTEPLARVLSGDADTMAALQDAVEWTRNNNSFAQFDRNWSSLVLTVLGTSVVN